MSSQLIIEQMLTQLGLLDESWTELETIDAGCAFVLENIDLLALLPKRVRGNLQLLESDIAKYRRKTLMGLCRRLAKELQGGIIRRRKQVRINNKTVSKYSYRLIKG